MKTIALIIVLAVSSLAQTKEAPKLSDAQKIDLLVASRDWSLAQTNYIQAQKNVEVARAAFDKEAARLRELAKKAEVAGWKLNIESLKYEEVKPVETKK